MGESTATSQSLYPSCRGPGAEWKRLDAIEVAAIPVSQDEELRISVVHLRACATRPHQKHPPVKTRVSIQLWRRGALGAGWNLRNELRLLPLRHSGEVAEVLRRAVEQANAKGWR